MHKHRNTLCNYITEVKIVNMYDDMNIMMHSVETQEVILIVFWPYFTQKTKRVKWLVVASKLGT